MWTFALCTLLHLPTSRPTQTLQVNNSNLQFTIAYTNFINEENELKEVINIFTPLGVNLQKRISIHFHEGIKINLPYLKCEAVGCIILITNNSKDPVDIKIFESSLVFET